MKTHEEIIRDYIEAYNQFDIDKMMGNLDDEILFENIQGGQKTLTLIGRDSFRQQAVQALSYFSLRTQTIQSFRHDDPVTEIEIDYHAKLAMDFPNGWKKGDEIRLKGKSLFEFRGNKIIKLTDIS